MTTDEQPEPVRDETAVIRRVCAALDTLDLRAQRRIVDYIADRYAPHDRQTDHA